MDLLRGHDGERRRCIGDPWLGAVAGQKSEVVVQRRCVQQLHGAIGRDARRRRQQRVLWQCNRINSIFIVLSFKESTGTWTDCEWRRFSCSSWARSLSPSALEQRSSSWRTRSDPWALSSFVRPLSRARGSINPFWASSKHCLYLKDIEKKIFMSLLQLIQNVHWRYLIQQDFFRIDWDSFEFFGGTFEVRQDLWDLVAFQFSIPYIKSFWGSSRISFFTCGITFESMDVVLSFFLKAIFEDLKSFMRIHCKLKLEFQGSLSIFPTWIYFSLIFEFLGGSFDCIVLQSVFKIHIGIFLGLDCHWNISSKRFS